MMKKGLKQISMIAAMLMLLSSQLFAQNQHIIGDGTTEVNYPPNTQVFGYGWSSMLYTNEEMGNAKSIIKIAFDQTTDYAGYWEYAVLENQKVYIKQTSDSNFGTLAYEDPDNSANGYTLVFDGTIQFNLGWTEIELSTAFEYDGTSALIVHYENHRGTSAPIVNVKFNASEVSNNVFKALGGDGTFPTSFGTFVMDRPNIAIYYNGDGPASPVNPTPANNSIKAKVDTDLEFIIGDNTTSYDVYFGTENPPTQLLIADANVSAPGTYSCKPSDVLGNLLDPKTKYYWQVVAKDGAATPSSQVWNLTTQGVWEDFPYFTSFEDSPIRTTMRDSVDWSWPYSAPVGWHMDSTYPHSGYVEVACNIWGEYAGDGSSLVSPRMYLPANQRVSFWWKITGGDLSGLDVYFEITTNGGDSWEELQQFQPDAPMANMEQSLISLAGYEGDNVYFRWRYESLESWVSDYFFMDDLLIEDAPTGAQIQIEFPSIEFLPLAVGSETYLPLEVTNIGVVDLLITGSTMSAPYSFELPAAIPAGQSIIIDITMTANAMGTFDQTFEFTGDFDGNEEVQLSGSVYQSTYEFFYNADVSLDLPENWNVIRTLDPYDIFTNVEVKQTAYDAYSPPNAVRMLKMNDTVSPLMLVTEGVSGYNANILRFYAKKSYDDYDAELQIGLTTDPLHPEAFTAVETFVMTTEYQLFEVEFPNSSSEPYIAFSFLGGRYASSIWIDDISWDVFGYFPPYCPEIIYPQTGTVNIDVMMGLEFNWTSGGGNPTGFKLSLGTNPEANNILNNVDLGEALTYTFPGTPAYNQQYYWKVVAYNNWGESTGCGTYSFTTMQNPLETVPFAENFDQIDALGDRDYPLGWSIENANNDNFPWDLISNIVSPDVVHSAPNAMHMLFSLNAMDDYLFTPPVQLEAGTGYEVSFWYKTMGDPWVPYPVERMKVFLGYDNNGAGMTTQLWINETIANQTWQQGTATFTADASGEYYFGFYGYSLPNQGLLLLDDVAIDLYTGVDETEQNSLSFFPNPATDQIQIVSEELVKQVKIYNIAGKLVFNENYNDNNFSLGIQNLNDGLYMIAIKTEDKIIREKLIVR